MTEKTNSADIKSLNFRRLANARTNRVIKQLQLLRNLSNTSTYSYSEDEINAIISAIELELSDVKRIFNKKLSKTASFALSK